MSRVTSLGKFLTKKHYFLWAFSKKMQKFCGILSPKLIQFLQNIRWATILATFLQKHPVTLAMSRPFNPLFIDMTIKFRHW
jgi:hypothetical protein